MLQSAAEKINLADRGIKKGLNIRCAATEARLLELAKGQAPEGAQSLAHELDNVLVGVARVVQPMKLVSLRVSGLYIQFSVSAQPSSAELPRTPNKFPRKALSKLDVHMAREAAVVVQQWPL